MLGGLVRGAVPECPLFEALSKWRHLRQVHPSVQGPQSRVISLQLRIQGSGFEVEGFMDPGFGVGFRVQGLGFRVSGFGFRVSGRVWGSRVQGFGFGV